MFERNFLSDFLLFLCTQSFHWFYRLRCWYSVEFNFQIFYLHHSLSNYFSIVPRATRRTQIFTDGESEIESLGKSCKKKFTSNSKILKSKSKVGSKFSKRELKSQSDINSLCKCCKSKSIESKEKKGLFYNTRHIENPPDMTIRLRKWSYHFESLVHDLGQELQRCNSTKRYGFRCELIVLVVRERGVSTPPFCHDTIPRLLPLHPSQSNILHLQ